MKVYGSVEINLHGINMNADYLKSLSFPEMNDRFHEITKPASNTCAWLLQHKSYCTWLDENSDLLCIKGKPGAGKSTLMKFAIEERTFQTPVLASFFFHARGTELQNTRVGLYRSLIHQLLLQVSSLRSDFREYYQKKKQASKSWNWDVTDLQELLANFITKAGKIVPIFIYIDALDECGPEEEKNLMDYLQTLTGSESSIANKSTKICFSRRHYPYINLPNCLEIFADEENEDGITTYINTVFEAKYLNVFRGTDITIIEEIRMDISKRSPNVFQWVSLILKIIDDMCVKRKPWKFIRRKISEMPSVLTDLYTHILRTMHEEDLAKASVLLRWVQFAKRPLTPNELRIAMAFDTDTPYRSLKTWRESDEYNGNFSQWKKQIAHLSAGLAEVVRRERHHYAEGKDIINVQFIHGSVNDYLQKEGLSMLGITQAGSVVGQCHKHIARSCVYYIKCPEHVEGKLSVETEPGDENNCSTEAENGYLDKTKNETETEPETGDEDGYNITKTAYDDRKFTNYAHQGWLWHSEQAENENCSLEDILVWSGYPSPKFIAQHLQLGFSAGLTLGSTYLHIASSANLVGLANMLLTRHRLNVDGRDDQGGTPLHVAADLGKERMVELLLRGGADVNARGVSHGNALQLAVVNGHITVTELLLKNGADVNAQSGYYSTALQAAANRGHIKLVELLLKNGANINAQGGFFGSALNAAKMGHEKGCMAVVQLLLKAGAKPTKKPVISKLSF